MQDVEFPKLPKFAWKKNFEENDSGHNRNEWGISTLDQEVE